MSHPIVQLLYGQPVSFKDVYPFLRDERFKTLARRLTVLKHVVAMLDKTLDPYILYDSETQLSEAHLAQTLKNYYAYTRSMVSKLFERLIGTYLKVCDALLKADPLVDHLAEITKNLQQLYNTILSQSKTIMDAVNTLVDASRYPDETLKTEAQIKTEWNALKLILKHLVIDALGSSILEHVRVSIVEGVLKGAQ